MQKIALRSLQEYSADDINRRHFQMQFFLALSGLKEQNALKEIKSKWKEFAHKEIKSERINSC